jgi:DNA-binding PadR family transcriptional regulator
MMSRGTRLTPTTYAVLGLLALRPWTTYELTQQMERGVRRFWPRARSKLYEEPKKLVDAGYAAAKTGATGRRPRTVYSITPEGRRALRHWLTEPGDGPTLEFEQLLKTFFAEHGTRESLLQRLAATRVWVRAENAENVEVARTYRDGAGDFPERLAVHLLVGRFLIDHYDMVLRWSEWATHIVEAWPDELTTAVADPADLEETVRRAEDIERRLADS